MSNNGKIIPREYVAPIPIPPGETLKEIMDELDMSQKEAAERLGITAKHLSFVVNGKAEISRDLADKLEYVFGIEAIFWLGLENEYREALKKLNPLIFTQEEEEIAKAIPYAELAKAGYINKTKKIAEKIVNLRSFFSVSNLELIPRVNCAFRKANITNENQYALAAWIRIAELQAQKIETERFNRKKLISSLDKIKCLSRSKPEDFYRELVDLMASCGIALVVANHLKGTGVHGVTFLNNKKNKLIIQLSVRRKYADTFWFTLFHEISHIVADESEKFSYISCDEKVEEEMNNIARNILIPEEKYRSFVGMYNYRNYNNICWFAENIGIHPCIVIGRLQYDHYLNYNDFSDKKPQYKIG